MIDDITSREIGGEAAVAIPLGDARALTAPRTWADRAFALAVAAIALHVIAGLVRASSGGVLVTRLGEVALVGLAAWGTVLLFPRSGTSTRMALALAIGAAAVIAGLGFTAGHIWKLGFDWSRVPGLASLLGGLALLGVAGALAVRALPGRRKLLLVPAALGLIFYLLVPGTIAVFITHVPPTTLGGWRPSDRGLAYRDVVVRTVDGVALSGWYVPPRNGAAVVLLHGSGSTRLNVLDHLEVLADAGYGVLALDARGHGESGGRAMDLGWLADRDFEAGVEFLARRGVDRIGAFGLSMGAIGALTAAAEDPRIDAVVAEGTAVHSTADALALGWDGWWHLPFYWTAITTMDLLSPAEPTMPVEEAIDRIGERPVMLISGRGRDEGILNRRYAAGAADGELLQLPDTKHSQGIWFHEEEWTGRVLGFLDRALLG